MERTHTHKHTHTHPLLHQSQYSVSWGKYQNLPSSVLRLLRCRKLSVNSPSTTPRSRNLAEFGRDPADIHHASDQSRKLDVLTCFEVGVLKDCVLRRWRGRSFPFKAWKSNVTLDKPLQTSSMSDAKGQFRSCLARKKNT